MMEVDRIICGDCRKEMKQFPDNSFDAILTDPPYELKFMGKKWDASGIAYDPAVWANCLRVLKPGGHMLAFGGARTYHRMACAIEDAGFEIRDSLHWVYGSGFPKSLDISKALDKMAGAERAQGEPKTDVTGRKRALEPNKGNSNGFSGALNVNRYEELPVTTAAKQWAGFGTALKTAHEPIVLARKPLEEKTIAANVLKWGCGGLNIDACRIGTEGGSTQPSGMDRYNAKLAEQGYRPNEYQQGEPAAPLPAGRFPANLIWSHSPNCKRIGTKKIKPLEGHRPNPIGKQSDGNIQFTQKEVGFQKVSYTGSDGLEEVESWDCAPDCPSWEFAKAGERKSGFFNGHRNKPKTKNDFGIFKLQDEAPTRGESTGSAARFFKSCPFTEEDIPAFLYYAKASKSERGEGNNHPTVKNLSLMRYLCRLITPLGGLILDPFTGSGTTCLAAKLESFRFIGIEKEPEYVEIARKRLAALPRKLTDFGPAAACPPF